MRGAIRLLAAAASAVLLSAAAHAQVAAGERTADLPDSWLVLYNLNDTESVAWKNWYIAQWGIPSGNTLGLDVTPTDERIHLDTYVADIYDPVVAHLAANPELAARIMGILVGYRVPGNCYKDDTHPLMPGGGGWSISSNLHDLNSATAYKGMNPHYFLANPNGPAPRRTKATLNPGYFLTGRIDAPTLADAQALTVRARAIALASAPLPADEGLYYDDLDVGAAGGDTWQSMTNLVDHPLFSDPTEYPWIEFESEAEAAPRCAAQFSYYRITGWQSVDWGGTPGGTRIFGYALNSFGATTVRSTTGLGGRYVPNALVQGGFAAAFGATAEPFLGNEPEPRTLIWCLAQGWTLAEASFHATPHVNYMWEAVGDPLLRVPYWFGASANTAPDAPSTLGPAELVLDYSITSTTPTFTFTQSDADGDALAFRIQVDSDADFGSPVLDYQSAASAVGPAQFTVGQARAGGAYLAGSVGQRLEPGEYYWRVASDDGEVTSGWAIANGGDPGFGLVEPIVDCYAGGLQSLESAGTATVIVQLEFPSDETITIDFGTVDGLARAGVDFAAAAGTLQFAPGEQQRSFDITLLDDTIDEPDMHLQVVLSNAVHARVGVTNNPATVIIADDDAPPAGGDGGGSGGGGGGGNDDEETPDPADTDGDGTLDVDDNCPALKIADQRDSDQDGWGDACDGCPADVKKQSAGLCGCGVSEGCDQADPGADDPDAGGGSGGAPIDPAEDVDTAGVPPVVDAGAPGTDGDGSSAGNGNATPAPSDESPATGLCGAGMSVGMLMAGLMLYGLRLGRLRRR